MPDNPNTAEPAKPRRWFQFRLLMLFGMASLAIVCELAHEAARTM